MQSILGQKYGYRTIPSVITQGTLTQRKLSEKSLSVLQRWYIRDDNAVPPAYTLAPISHRVPNFQSNSCSEAEREAGDVEWLLEYAALQDAWAELLKDETMNAQYSDALRSGISSINRGTD